MRTLIWISGPINSGKTTIAELLAKRLHKAVNIELDILCSFETHLDIDKKLHFIIQDAIDLAANWVERDYLPILNWPIYKNEVGFMFEYAKYYRIQPILINLTPEIDIVKKNRGSRNITETELQRIDYMYHICDINNPQYGYKIDNSILTPDKTIGEILNILDQNGVLFTL